MSATPIGMPGCPDFACSTASMASARMALAMRWCWARADGLAEASAVIDAAAAETARGGMGFLVFESGRGRKRLARGSTMGAKRVNQGPADSACRAQGRGERRWKD